MPMLLVVALSLPPACLSTIPRIESMARACHRRASIVSIKFKLSCTDTVYTHCFLPCIFKLNHAPKYIYRRPVRIQVYHDHQCTQCSKSSSTSLRYTERRLVKKKSSPPRLPFPTKSACGLSLKALITPDPASLIFPGRCTMYNHRSTIYTCICKPRRGA